MNKILKLSLAVSAITTTLLAQNSISTEEEQLVKSVVPGTKIAKVQKAQIDGLYKAYLENSGLIYVQPFNKLIFLGEIYTADGKSLTEADRDEWQSENSAKKLLDINVKELLNVSKKVSFNKGSKRYEFVIFTDPECPYCARVEEYLLNKDATVHISFYPLDFHPNAKNWALSMLSAKDFQKTFMTFVKNRQDPKIKPNNDAELKLSKMIELAAKHNVEGTPMIMIIDKKEKGVVEIINGANLTKIDKYLTKDKQ